MARLPGAAWPMTNLLQATKDTLTVVRETLFVALFLLLVLWPTTFNSILQRAGFTKGSLLGFEWEKKIQASTEDAKSAGGAIAQIQERLQVLQRAVESASGPE